MTWERDSRWPRSKRTGRCRSPVTTPAPRVSKFFGSGITSYEWVYVVAPDRVSSLQAILSEEAEGDLFAALEAFYGQHGGQLHDLLTMPDVGADFSNWHS